MGRSVKKTACSEEHIQKAVREVLRGNMSIRKACDKYMVGRQKLRNRLDVASGKKILKKQGRKRVLAPSQEEELVTTVTEMNQLGFGPTTRQLRGLLLEYALVHEIRNPVVKSPSGKHSVATNPAVFSLIHEAPQPHQKTTEDDARWTL